MTSLGPEPEGLLPSLALRLKLGAQVQLVARELPAYEQVIAQLGHLLPGSLASAVPKRRAEFAAGRHVAALALARYGCLTPVERRADGAPGWPSGFVGSISHAGGLVVAAVARTDAQRSLGIDIEQIVSEDLSRELAARVLSPAELELLTAALPSAPPQVLFTLGFSAKESLFKCLYPLGQEFFDFDDARIVRLQLDSDGRGCIELGLVRPLRGGFAAGHRCRGPFAMDSTRVETAILLDP